MEVEAKPKRVIRRRPKKDKISIPAVTKILCDVPEEFDSAEHDIALISKVDNKDIEPLIYETLPHMVREVRIKKTPQEKAETRRLFRREYIRLPYVQETLKKRLSDPTVIAKRKEYAEREDVKQHKKDLAKQQRQIRKHLKDKAPQLYEEILKEVKQACLTCAQDSGYDGEDDVQNEEGQ